MAQSIIGNYMERIQNASNGGQQAPDQIPATEATRPTEATRHATRATRHATRATRHATRATRPPADFVVADFVGHNVSPLDGVPLVFATRPDGTAQGMKFGKVLHDRKVVNAFLKKINYDRNFKRLQETVKEAIPNDSRLQSSSISELGRLAPFLGGGRGVDPVFLYQLFVLHPDELGEALAER
ncbi:MAG: hypothetical protein LBC11_00305 [Puniceicoccales bacterium]|nr:hypothetical protein [Puniceicoccales bacterium]